METCRTRKQFTGFLKRVSLQLTMTDFKTLVSGSTNPQQLLDLGFHWYIYNNIFTAEGIVGDGLTCRIENKKLLEELRVINENIASQTCVFNFYEVDVVGVVRRRKINSVVA